MNGSTNVGIQHSINIRKRFCVSFQRAWTNPPLSRVITVFLFINYEKNSDKVAKRRKKTGWSSYVDVLDLLLSSDDVQHSQALAYASSKLLRGCELVCRRMIDVLFICVCIWTRTCLCQPCAIGCLQVVYAERSDAKSLVKGANSLLKAVIPALMEIVFNRVSEKTRR